jgi:CRP/FNR family transcriptional regulator, cyclic AMP receptor protein
MNIVSELQVLPLFKGIPEARLSELVKALRSVSKKAGTVLFQPGDSATHFELLASGEVTIEEENSASANSTDANQGGPVKFQLHPLSPLGELGAFTGIPRCTKATATTDIELLSIPVGDLLGFFDKNEDVGFAFTKNLLGLVTDKLGRDRRLLGEMRANIIRTQKGMKHIRELVLESAETETSKPIFETLDGMIDNNRRVNYRVTPTTTYPAHVRMEDGRDVRVMEVSEGYIKLEGKTAELTNSNDFTGVLVMPNAEIVVSGVVHREAAGGVVLKLDAMIDGYKKTLADFVTRVQLLDYVV